MSAERFESAPLPAEQPTFEIVGEQGEAKPVTEAEVATEGLHRIVRVYNPRTSTTESRPAHSIVDLGSHRYPPVHTSLMSGADNLA